MSPPIPGLLDTTHVTQARIGDHGVITIHRGHIEVTFTGNITVTRTVILPQLESTQKALGATEVLENVLKFLSPTEILRAQEVSKFFRATVVGSNVCRDAAWLHRKRGVQEHERSRRQGGKMGPEWKKQRKMGERRLIEPKLPPYRLPGFYFDIRQALGRKYVNVQVDLDKHLHVSKPPSFSTLHLLLLAQPPPKQASVHVHCRCGGRRVVDIEGDSGLGMGVAQPEKGRGVTMGQVLNAIGRLGRTARCHKCKNAFYVRVYGRYSQ